ncbi:MAG: hypothetical protein P8N76_11350 [Pirellulaceae bacterium]|nr:hypothetical protein [Pirellulaceae bacterium]
MSNKATFPSLFVCASIVTLSTFTNGVLAQTYVDWTLETGSSGTGTLAGAGGVPDFSFAVTGDFSESGLLVDDEDVFDNATWESLFGEGDNQESLRIQGEADFLSTSVLTIDFSSSVPGSTWAFAVTDLEGEDAIISATASGVPVSNATIASWFQELFDSKPGPIDLPSGFDAANAALVAQFDSDGLLSQVPPPTSRVQSRQADGLFQIRRLTR